MPANAIVLYNGHKMVVVVVVVVSSSSSENVWLGFCTCYWHWQAGIKGATLLLSGMHPSGGG